MMQMESRLYRKPKPRLWERFEERVREFLKDLKFEDVDGGRRFIINGVQVDAVGGHEKTLLVIECTTKRKLRKEIEEIRGNIKILEKGFGGHPKYKKYRRHCLLIATNTRKIRPEDEKFSQQKPRIFLWDGRFLGYYERLYKLIGEYAKYNLLAEIGIKPSKKSLIEVMALKTKIKDYPVYQFFIDPKKLLEVSYVARRERGIEQYYQRLIRKNRLRDIVKFLDQRGGLFPTNMVISIYEPRFEPINKLEGIEIGVLKFPNEYRSCWVIDGQHRLYSFSHSESRIPISVLAFERLGLEQHARFFLEINKEQKPVPPDLLWDLEGLLRPNEEEGIISRACKILNQMKGPLKGRIYIPLHGPRKKGMLKLSGLCRSIQKAKLAEEHCANLRPAKGVNPFFDRNPEKMVKKLSSALNTYFSFVDQNFGDKEKKNFVFTNGGISVMIYLFERVIARLVKKPRKRDFEKYLSPVMDYLKEYRDIRGLRDRCNSEGGRDGVVRDFLRSIYRKTEDREILGAIEPLDLGKEVREEFEPSVRRFVKKVLVKKFPQEWVKRIPSDIVADIKRKHEVEPPNEEFFERLDLGQCEKIMRKNDRSFQKLLLHSKFGFADSEQLWAMYHTLKRFRDATAHGMEVELRYKGEDFIRLVLDKFNICFEESLKIT